MSELRTLLKADGPGLQMDTGLAICNVIEGPSKILNRGRTVNEQRYRYGPTIEFDRIVLSATQLVNLELKLLRAIITPTISF